MADTLIRKTQSGDLPALQQIARRTIDQSYRPFLGDQAVDWFINSGESDKVISDHIDNCDVLLATNKLLAFSIYFEDFIHVKMVDIDHHRTGTGTMLLVHVENQLFSSGRSTIRLETFEGNEQAINFYLKNGWSITGRQEDSEQGFVRVLFEKKLDEGDSSLPSG